MVSMCDSENLFLHVSNFVEFGSCLKDRRTHLFVDESLRLFVSSVVLSPKICHRFTVFLFIIRHFINGCSVHDHFPASASPPTCVTQKKRPAPEKANSRNSSMAPKNGGPSNWRKRKLMEVEETPLPTSAPLTASLFPLPQQQVSPHTSTALCLDLNRRLWPNPLDENETSIMSIPGPFPFKSFTSLLTGDDDQDSLPPNIREQNDQINQIIKFQADHLSRTLENVQKSTYKMLLSAAEERAGKKLKETQLELDKATSRIVGLQDKEAHLREEMLIMKSRIRHLEKTAATLSAQLQEAIIRGGNPQGVGCSHGQQEEEGESSVNPERVEPVVMLACRGCGKQLATVMLWPCRHICICRRCEVFTRNCPVCRKIKTTSTQVLFP